MRMRIIYQLLTLLLIFGIATSTVQAAEKPNILVIWGDDIGYWNLSHINHGMMGYQMLSLKTHRECHKVKVT